MSLRDTGEMWRIMGTEPPFVNNPRHWGMTDLDGRGDLGQYSPESIKVGRSQLLSPLDPGGKLPPINMPSQEVRFDVG